MFKKKRSVILLFLLFPCILYASDSPVLLKKNILSENVILENIQFEVSALLCDTDGELGIWGFNPDDLLIELYEKNKTVGGVCIELFVVPENVYRGINTEIEDQFFSITFDTFEMELTYNSISEKLNVGMIKKISTSEEVTVQFKPEYRADGVLRVGMFSATDSNKMNTSYIEGLTEAAGEFNIEPVIVNIDSYGTLKKSFEYISNNSELFDIFLIERSYFNKDVNIYRFAADNPAMDFLVIGYGIDEKRAPENLLACKLDYQNPSFLIGVLCGLLTKDYSYLSPKLNEFNVLGVVYRSPYLYKDLFGYISGVRYINPECTIYFQEKNEINSNRWYTRGTERMFEGYADIVFFQRPRNLTAEVIQIAERQNGLLIHDMPLEVEAMELNDDSILTSINIDYKNIMFNILSLAVGGELTRGKDNYIDPTINTEPFIRSSNFDNIVSDEVLNIINEVRSLLVSGEIVPPSDIEELTKQFPDIIYDKEKFRFRDE